jgi:hypothetical protein
MRSPNQAVTPVRDKPSPTINKAVIMITVESPKPDSACSRVMIPAKNKVSNDNKATTSALSRPKMKKIIVIARMTKVKIIDIRYGNRQKPEGTRHFHLVPPSGLYVAG